MVTHLQEDENAKGEGREKQTELFFLFGGGRGVVLGGRKHCES